jgi:hypothetical protein
MRARPDANSATPGTQVAELLGCSTARVYELCERSELPYFRDSSNSLRFPCKAFDRMLRPKRSGPTTGEKL